MTEFIDIGTKLFRSIKTSIRNKQKVQIKEVLLPLLNQPTEKFGQILSMGIINTYGTDLNNIKDLQKDLVKILDLLNEGIKDWNQILPNTTDWKEKMENLISTFSKMKSLDPREVLDYIQTSKTLEITKNNKVEVSAKKCIPNISLLEQIAEYGKDIDIIIELTPITREDLTELRKNIDYIEKMSIDMRKAIGTSEIWSNIGRLLYRFNDLEYSLKSYIMSILLDKNNLTSYVNLAIIMDIQKQGDVSKRYFQKLIREDPKNAIAWALLGSESDRDEAIKCFTTAIEINPELSIAWSGLGLYLDDLQEAERCCRKALEIDPKNAKAWYGLYVIFKNTEEGSECLKKAKELGLKGI